MRRGVPNWTRQASARADVARKSACATEILKFKLALMRISSRMQFCPHWVYLDGETFDWRPAMRSVLLKSSPLLLIVLGVLLYPRLTNYAQSPKRIAMPEATTFRILLGIGDTEPTDWDGSVKLSGGAVTGIQGWRFADRDSSDYKSSWKASTRRQALPAAQKKKKADGGPLLENGVLISAALSSP